MLDVVLNWRMCNCGNKIFVMSSFYANLRERYKVATTKEHKGDTGKAILFLEQFGQLIESEAQEAADRGKTEIRIFFYNCSSNGFTRFKLGEFTKDFSSGLTSSAELGRLFSLSYGFHVEVLHPKITYHDGKTSYIHLSWDKEEPAK